MMMSNGSVVLAATTTSLDYTNGYISSAGDAIVRQYILFGTTTNATETEIFIGGNASVRIPLTANTTVFYTADIAARDVTHANSGAAFGLKGVSHNYSGVSSDLGAVTETIVTRSNINIGVDIRASDTTDTVNVYVQGIASTTYKWIAMVQTTEIKAV
jgi:hypothetical protein